MDYFTTFSIAAYEDTPNKGTTPLTITTIATESFWIVDGRMTLSWSDRCNNNKQIYVDL